MGTDINKSRSVSNVYFFETINIQTDTQNVFDFANIAGHEIGWWYWRYQHVDSIFAKLMSDASAHIFLANNYGFDLFFRTGDMIGDLLLEKVESFVKVFDLHSC